MLTRTFFNPNEGKGERNGNANANANAFSHLLTQRHALALDPSLSYGKRGRDSKVRVDVRTHSNYTLFARNGRFKKTFHSEGDLTAEKQHTQ